MNCDVGKATEGLENELYLRHSSFSYPSLLHLCHSSFSNPSFACPTSQALHVIHLASRSAHSQIFPSLHLRRNSFSNPSYVLPTSQLILQSFRCFTYVTTHSPTFFRFSYVTGSSLNVILQPFLRFTYVAAHYQTIPSLYLRHSSFSNPSVASPTSQIILQSFFRFSYVTGSSLNVILQPFLRFTYVASPFSNPSVALPTSQLILQSFPCLTYVTADFPTLLSLLLRHRLFT